MSSPTTMNIDFRQNVPPVQLVLVILMFSFLIPPGLQLWHVLPIFLGIYAVVTIEGFNSLRSIGTAKFSFGKREVIASTLVWIAAFSTLYFQTCIIAIWFGVGGILLTATPHPPNPFNALQFSGIMLAGTAGSVLVSLTASVVIGLIVRSLPTRRKPGSGR